MTWKDTTTQTVDVGGTAFAYRELGPRGDTPLVFLHHFTAVLDDWDPRVVDGLAADRLARLAERTTDRVKPITQQARIAQLLAIREAGLGEPHDLSRITQPTFVANGDRDVMVATGQSHDLAARIPDAQLTIYPDSGHGGIFQYHRAFVSALNAFLETRDRATG